MRQTIRINITNFLSVFSLSPFLCVCARLCVSHIFWLECRSMCHFKNPLHIMSKSINISLKSQSFNHSIRHRLHPTIGCVSHSVELFTCFYTVICGYKPYHTRSCSLYILPFLFQAFYWIGWRCMHVCVFQANKRAWMHTHTHKSRARSSFAHSSHVNRNK